MCLTLVKLFGHHTCVCERFKGRDRKLKLVYYNINDGARVSTAQWLYKHASRSSSDYTLNNLPVRSLHSLSHARYSLSCSKPPAWLYRDRIQLMLSQWSGRFSFIRTSVSVYYNTLGMYKWRRREVGRVEQTDDTED